MLAASEHPADAEQLHGFADDLDTSAGIKTPLAAGTWGWAMPELKGQQDVGARGCGNPSGVGLLSPHRL